MITDIIRLLETERLRPYKNFSVKPKQIEERGYNLNLIPLWIVREDEMIKMGNKIYVHPYTYCIFSASLTHDYIRALEELRGFIHQRIDGQTRIFPTLRSESNHGG